ncbi:hypothetical protein L541_0427 [Bordetella hinzii CA90 BAL1384]|nr:hypothetical protein L543_0435 [Bordetella hinzii L60]KCB34104.1 hypothetical protein L541_0427 [Bordetella hinzii CA90 BAL1384]
MRYLGEPNGVVGLPLKLVDALVNGDVCVYVAIHDSIELAEVFK